MEGSPLSPESDIGNQESRRKREIEEKKIRESRVKKPENLGFLAVESKPDEASIFERAREQEPKADKREFKFTEGSEGAAESVPQKGPKKSTERIGRVLLGNETAASETIRPPTAAESKPAVESKRTEAASQEELMDLAEKIHVNGDSLQHIYETHLIGERGLQRVVEAYRSGGNLQEALEREILERERDFERDPAMRDHAASGINSAGASLSGLDDPALRQLLGKTESPAGSITKKSARSDRRQSAHGRQGTRSYKTIVDVIFFGIIGLLILLIIIIYLKRS